MDVTDPNPLLPSPPDDTTIDATAIARGLRALLDAQPAEDRAELLAGLVAITCLFTESGSGPDLDLEDVIEELVDIVNGDADPCVTHERTTLQ